MDSDNLAVAAEKKQVNLPHRKHSMWEDEALFWISLGKKKSVLTHLEKDVLQVIVLNYTATPGRETRSRWTLGTLHVQVPSRGFNRRRRKIEQKMDIFVKKNMSFEVSTGIMCRSN